MEEVVLKYQLPFYLSGSHSAHDMVRVFCSRSTVQTKPRAPHTLCSNSTCWHVQYNTRQAVLTAPCQLGTSIQLDGHKILCE